MVENPNKNVHFRPERNEMMFLHDLKGVMHDEPLICFERIFQGKTQVYVVQNAFANHPRVMQHTLDWRHLIKLEYVFINVCSDDCLTAKAV